MPYDYLNGARNWIQRHSLKKPFNNNNNNNNNNNRGPPFHVNRYGKCYFDIGNFGTDFRNVPPPMPLCRYRPKTANKSCQTVEEQPPKCICGNNKSMLCRECLTVNVLGIGRHQQLTQEADSESIGSLSSSDFILEPKSQGELLLQSLQRSALEAKIASGSASARLDPKFVMSARSIVSRNAFELRPAIEEDTETDKLQQKDEISLDAIKEIDSSAGVTTETKENSTPLLEVTAEATPEIVETTNAGDPNPLINGEHSADVYFEEVPKNLTKILEPEVEVLPVTNLVAASNLAEMLIENPLTDCKPIVSNPPDMQPLIEGPKIDNVMEQLSPKNGPKIDNVMEQLSPKNGPNIDKVMQQLSPRKDTRFTKEFLREIEASNGKPTVLQLSQKRNMKTPRKSEMEMVSTKGNPMIPNSSDIPKPATTRENAIVMNQLLPKENERIPKKFPMDIPKEIPSTYEEPISSTYEEPMTPYPSDIPPLLISSETDIVINELSPKRNTNRLSVLEEETFYTTTKFSQYANPNENIYDGGDVFRGHSTRITHIQQNERYCTITKSLNNLFDKRCGNMECYDDVAVAFNYASKSSRNQSTSKIAYGSQDNLTETDSNYQSNSGCDEDNEAFEIQIYTVEDGHHMFNSRRSSYLTRACLSDEKCI